MYLDIKVPFEQCTLLQWSLYPYNQDHCETFYKSHNSFSYCSCDLSYTLLNYYYTNNGYKLIVTISNP